MRTVRNTIDLQIINNKYILYMVYTNYPLLLNILNNLLQLIIIIEYTHKLLKLCIYENIYIYAPICLYYILYIPILTQN